VLPADATVKPFLAADAHVQSSPVDRVGSLLAPIPLAVFVSGVASMGLEIVAGRLLAPGFGSSVYVWGSIIAVFLAALALGYWIAGKTAANRASRAGLALALVGAAAYVAFVMVFGETLVAMTEDLPIWRRFLPLVPVTLLFGPPTVLLGFVSPYGAELIDARSTGDASGQVYALGTGGSIVGAFATTFVLVPEFGVLGMEALYGGLLVLAAIVVAPRSTRRPQLAAVVVGVAIVLAVLLVGVIPLQGSGTTVAQTQTEYQELRVADDGDVRTLWLDGVRHSAMFLDDPDRYVFEYTRYFHLPYLFQDDVDRVLFVGGGGFSGPKRFLAEYPNVTVDVVELDPAVVDTARRHFDVPETDRLNVHVGDGRVFLADTTHTYDVVVLDAYRADRVPYHLTTVEFMRLVRSKLDADGTLVANVISAPSGQSGAFYRAQYRTMEVAFPRVYSFPTSEASSVQNIMLVATNADERVTQAELRRRNRQRDVGVALAEAVSHYRASVETTDAPVLRDGHAPVDSLLAEQLGRRYIIERTVGNQTTAAAD